MKHDEGWFGGCGYGDTLYFDLLEGTKLLNVCGRTAQALVK
jgi:hypothetical protein